MFSDRTCSITCAYCHIVGHHIRNCVELANKNRRKRDTCLVPAKPTPAITKQAIVAPKNAFSALYSSSDDEDDEVEEGEIVEERRRPLSSPSEEGEKEEEEPRSWSRSGIKGVKIEITQPTTTDEPDYEFNEERYNEYLRPLREYVAQFKGMAWSDI